MPLLDAGLFSSVSCRGCQQEPPPMTSRYDLALEPLRARLRSVTPHVFALEPTSLPFARRSLRCDGGVSDSNARSRRRPTERAGRHLEPRTAKRLLQLHTTHARVHERAIFALAMGCAHQRVSPRRELAPACARRRTMCPRPARRPDTHFLRMGREGAHGSESRVEGRGSRSRVAFSRRGLGAAQSPKRVLRAKWRVAIPSSFSLRAPRCRQRGFGCGARVPVRIP